MGEPQGDVQNVISTPTVGATTQVASTVQGMPKGNFNVNTKVNNMAELKEKAPEVWDAMLKSLAQSMINEMSRNEERAKRRRKEERARDGG